MQKSDHGHSYQAVAWIPMDVVASTVNDLIHSTDNTAQLLNVVHPRPTSWNDIFTSVNTELATQLPFVPYAQWLDKLSALASDASIEQMKEVVSQLRYTPSDER